MSQENRQDPDYASDFLRVRALRGGELHEITAALTAAARHAPHCTYPVAWALAVALQRGLVLDLKVFTDHTRAATWRLTAGPYTTTGGWAVLDLQGAPLCTGTVDDVADWCALALDHGLDGCLHAQRIAKARIEKGRGISIHHLLCDAWLDTRRPRAVFLRLLRGRAAYLEAASRAADLVPDLELGATIGYGPADLAADIEAELVAGRPQALQVGAQIFVPVAGAYVSVLSGQPVTVAAVVAAAAELLNKTPAPGGAALTGATAGGPAEPPSGDADEVGEPANPGREGGQHATTCLVMHKAVITNEINEVAT